MDRPMTEEENGSTDNSEILDDFEIMEALTKTEQENLRKYSFHDFYFRFTGGATPQNAVVNEVSESRMSSVNEIMEALTDHNISIMGVCGKDNTGMGYLLERIKRRARRDNLFGMIVMVSIREKPALRIQEEIAHELGFSFEGQGQEEKCAFCVFPNSDNKAVTENARQLSDLIRMEPKILYILRDLQIRLGLAELGIPFGFGVDQQGCKLILTSESEEIQSKQMNTQRTFKV